MADQALPPLARKLSLPARVLLCFCRAPGTRDYPMKGIHYHSGEELARLEAVFPGIAKEVAGKVVVDFGCGAGYQTAAIAKLGAKEVLAVEIDEPLLKMARQRAMDLGLTGTVSFASAIPPGKKADVIISQNSFEHFIDARQILAGLRDALATGGKIFVTFAPPWYAPWGAHAAFFCKLPWIQLIFSEETVMEVRSLFRPDGKRTYRDSGLAQMSLRKFESIVADCGLTCTFKRYDCVLGLNWLRNTPLRELFVNCVSCTLEASSK